MPITTLASQPNTPGSSANISRTTAEEVLGEEAAAPAIRAAERIAQSLWLAKFATPFDDVPEWISARSSL